jgi:hypothetical protein
VFRKIGLFDRGRTDWVPIFDEERVVEPSHAGREVLAKLDLVPREDLPWQHVRGLAPASPDEPDGYQLALRESAPDSGSFVLFSLRRRSESQAKNGKRRK